MIDEPLQEHFIFCFIMYVIILGFSIAASLTFKSLVLFLLTFILIVLFSLYTLYQVLKCIEDDVYRLELSCIEVYTPKFKLRQPHMTFTRDYCIFETSDEQYVKIYNLKHKKIKEQNNIVVYFPKNAIARTNDDLFVLHNYYYIYLKNFKKRRR